MSHKRTLLFCLLSFAFGFAVTAAEIESTAGTTHLALETPR